MRVPLLEPSAIVLHRLDLSGTRAVDPPGAGTVGYDPDMLEPLPYEDATTGDREDTRQYWPPVRIPCQVEMPTFEEMRQLVPGDVTVTNVLFVLHKMDLARLGLLKTAPACPGGQGTKIKTDDKISAVERNGAPTEITQSFKFPLYVVEVRPASWGMGPSGFDLYLLIVNNRPATPQP